MVTTIFLMTYLLPLFHFFQTSMQFYNKKMWGMIHLFTNTGIRTRHLLEMCILSWPLDKDSVLYNWYPFIHYFNALCGRCGRPWSRLGCRTHWRKPSSESGIRQTAPTTLSWVKIFQNAILSKTVNKNNFEMFRPVLIELTNSAQGQ